MKIKLFFCVLVGVFMQISHGQSVDVRGKISAADDVDGIHIINKTASRFTISRSNGHFTIPAKLNDTILFSGVSYQPKEIVVTKLIMASKKMSVYLEALVNALDEVVVGKILTGDLSFDLVNSGVERDINFFDLGIPGYTGKPLTQSERRLKEATGLDVTMGGGIGGGGFAMSLNPIINGISGRTSKLKEHVRLERLDQCLGKIKSNLSEILFSAHSLEEPYRKEFFYFCADNPQFDALCKINNDFKTLEFLKDQLVSFKSNLEIKVQE